MSRLSYRAYARHRGCTLRAVQKAIEAGRIPVVVDESGRKWIDPVAADKAWSLNTDPAKQSLLYGGLQIPVADDPADLDEDLADALSDAPSTARPPSAADAPGPDGQAAAPPAAGDVDVDTLAYRRERAAREAIKRETEQIELDRLRGRLIDVDEATRIAFTAFRTLRDSLLNVPARLKDQVAAESDALRVEQILDTEIIGALDAFDLAAALRDTEPDDDPDDA